MKAIKFIAASPLIFAAAAVSAGEWRGAGEAGMVIVDGNSQSKVTNAALTFYFEDGAPWEHVALVSGINAEADGDKSAESYTLHWLSKYLLSERHYLFGDMRYFDDKFDSYKAIYTATLGAGYKLLAEEDRTWELAAGIGYRETEEEASGRDQNGISFLLTSAYNQQLTATTSIENNTRIEMSDDNTFTTNIFGLRVSINTDLALKVAYEWRYNTDTIPGVEDTDTISSVNLVYSF